MGITNGNGNKTRLNLGSWMAMGMNHWEWEEMWLKKTFPLISNVHTRVFRTLHGLSVAVAVCMWWTPATVSDISRRWRSSDTLRVFCRRPRLIWLSDRSLLSVLRCGTCWQLRCVWRIAIMHVSGVCWWHLDLERGRQTPNMGYHVACIFLWSKLRRLLGAAHILSRLLTFKDFASSHPEILTLISVCLYFLFILNFPKFKNK